MKHSLIKRIGYFTIILGLGLNVISFSKSKTMNTVVELSNITIMNTEVQTYNWTLMIGVLLICTGVIVVWQSNSKTKEI